ncbi:MAG: hypothetical protein QXF20_05750, partial [Candidatus Hadarchaeales archaeon]
MTEGSPLDEILRLLGEMNELELEKVDLTLEELRFIFRPLMTVVPPPVKEAVPAKPLSLLEAEFS